MHQEFEDFASNFDLKDEGINLKFYHSKRVAIISARIAQNLGWDYHEVLLAKQIGLVHDIGRLKEWTDYKTFRGDFDHAEYGVEILEKDNYMQKFNISKEDFLTVCAAVYYHNKLTVPVEHENNQQVKLVRDADKIDIFYELSNQERVSRLGLMEHGISPKVKADFEEQKPIIIKDVKTIGDEILKNLAFIYDINFDYSLQLIKEQKYLANYYESLTDKKLYQGYFKK